MKIMCFKTSDSSDTKLGVVFNNNENVYALSNYGVNHNDLDKLILELNNYNIVEPKDGEVYKIADVINVAPMTRCGSDIICLGVNYMDHAAESAKFKNEKFDGTRPNAVYFSKRVSAPVGNNGGICSHSDITSQLDYEAEFAVIIGKDAKDVKAEDAKDYIFGYTILNDVSARDIQNKHKQWYFGKSLDGFCPIGPWIVTKDEFSFPPKVDIKSYVNGELRQSSNTELLIFDIPFVIEELSQGMTLKAGTIISTGTPAGVGMGFNPPKFLNVGDEVICEVEGIGKLINKVV